MINAYLHKLGIYPIGRFGEWKYVNQDGAILSAKRVVESLDSEGKLQFVPAPPNVQTPGAGPLSPMRNAGAGDGRPRPPPR